MAEDKVVSGLVPLAYICLSTMGQINGFSSHLVWRRVKVSKSGIGEPCFAEQEVAFIARQLEKLPNGLYQSHAEVCGPTQNVQVGSLSLAAPWLPSLQKLRGGGQDRAAFEEQL